MMYVFILITINMLLFGCSSTSSFEGELLENNKVHLVVDCSDEVNKGENNVRQYPNGTKIRIKIDDSAWKNE
jgi:predicted component of type VI protein secretion system